MRPIDADALHDRIKMYFCGCCWVHVKGMECGGGCHEKIILDFIEEAEAVDAEPVRRGQWIVIKKQGWHGDGFYSTAKAKCSACGYIPKPHIESSMEQGGSVTSYSFRYTKYCPECGAKMFKEGSQ